MKRILALAAVLPLLGGCSSMLAGIAAGGAGGFDGPGAAGIKLVQTAYGCPDLAAQGSIPLTGVAVSCSKSPDGTLAQTATIASANPETILLESMKAQAAQSQAMATLLSTLAPIVAQAAATAAGGPLAGAAAGAIVHPPVTPVTPATPAVPLLPTLPGPAAQ